MGKVEVFRVIKREEQLKRKDFEDCMGICMRCYKVTQVLKPCCHGDVSLNGRVYSPHEFEDLEND